MAAQNEAPLQAAAPRAERGQARVSVQVRDVNEAPVFQQNPLRTSLAEGAAPGTPVATFSARDPDTQQPQRLRWGPRGERGELAAPVHLPARVAAQLRVLSPVPGGFPSGPWSEGRGLICVHHREPRGSQVPCVRACVFT